MDIILVPGFWLQGDSWSEVTPVLEAAGHVTHPVTRPGLEPGGDPSSVSLADQVAAIVAEIDRAEGPVVLVGHSGAGPMVYDAADARLDRVARIVYVDTWPMPDGRALGLGYPVVDGAIPFPDWSAHDAEDVDGLDDETRARMEARVVPEPAASAADEHVQRDERRRSIPSTIISTSRSKSDYDEWLEHPMFAELVALENVEWVELPGASHWPQFTRPQQLGETIVAALGELAEK